MSIVKNYYGNDIIKIKIEIEIDDIQEAINFLKKYEEETKKSKNNNFLFFIYSIAQTMSGKVSFLYLNLQVESRITRNITCYLIIAFY